MAMPSAQALQCAKWQGLCRRAVGTGLRVTSNLGRLCRWLALLWLDDDVPVPTALTFPRLTAVSLRRAHLRLCRRHLCRRLALAVGLGAVPTAGFVPTARWAVPRG